MQGGDDRNVIIDPDDVDMNGIYVRRISLYGLRSGPYTIGCWISNILPTIRFYPEPKVDKKYEECCSPYVYKNRLKTVTKLVTVVIKNECEGDLEYRAPGGTCLLPPGKHDFDDYPG